MRKKSSAEAKKEVRATFAARAGAPLEWLVLVPWAPSFQKQ